MDKQDNNFEQLLYESLKHHGLIQKATEEEINEFIEKFERENPDVEIPESLRDPDFLFEKFKDHLN